ncbi:MAG: [FeFe] hydrogenase H-cluster maturation GTPase HydF [Bacteriovoracaceae bacterium]|nr:[FeFe] hydrogenase H-cluster maturation GTPase HydF [Bacteriovoracaceae bacterium]
MLKSQMPHIGIFGRRNVGKSSFINSLSNQDVAIVSHHPGTTTDPVSKTMEISGLGPSVIIDTAGIDDVGELGELRVESTKKVIRQINMAILVYTGEEFGEFERGLIEEFTRFKTPYFVIHSKSDLMPIDPEFKKVLASEVCTDIVDFSNVDRQNIEKVVATIKKSLPDSVFNNPTILGDLVKYGDVVLLVTPIDVEAPKGRIIQPQVQTIRDALDNDCIIMMAKEREIDTIISKMGIRPSLVVTDSQVFLKVDAAVPKDIPMTSFSILFARLKGDFEAFVEGTRHIGKLVDGDKILLLESCSHHVSCDDIGRVKIPRWLSNFTGKKLDYEIVSGLASTPRPIEEYSMVIQCGGCMLTRKQILNKIHPAIELGIPVSNYGMAISYCHGIFERSVAPFGHSATDEDDLL